MSIIKDKHEIAEEAREQNMVVYINSIFAEGKTLLYIGIGRHPEHVFLKQLIEKKFNITVLEIYEPYIEPAKKYINEHYAWILEKLETKVDFIVGDVLQVDEIFKGKKFDVVVWSHGPEHISMEKFGETINKLKQIAVKQLFISCPYGSYPQASIAGNKDEQHLWSVYPEDLEMHGFVTKTFGPKDLQATGPERIGSIVAYYDRWTTRQTEELDHWIKAECSNFANYDLWYAKTYGDISGYLKLIGYDYSVMAIGCSPYPYVCKFPFKNILLVDSLMDKYRKLSNNFKENCTLLNMRAEDIDLGEDRVDITFALNCLDHMNPDHLDTVLSKINYITKQYIFLFVDYHDNPDEHHFIFTHDLYKPFNEKFVVVKDIDAHRGDRSCRLPCKLLIYKRRTSPAEKNVSPIRKDYWWGGR